MSSAVLKVAPVKRANGSSRWRLFFVALVVLIGSSTAFAQTDAYAIRGNATAGSNNIWNVDLTTGVESLVYTNYPGGNAATLAQRPSDGMLFFSINATNGAVYRFNPATPNVAPVAIGNLGPTALGVNVSGGFRMAFSGNTLYYMIGDAGAGVPDNNVVYTLDQNTGLATKIATVTGTGNGGDIAFSSGGTLYVIDQNKVRCTYAGLPANGAATGCSTLGVSDTNSIGIAFDSGGQLLLQTVTNANLYRNTTLITALSGGNTATGDLASANVPAPNLSITKTDGATTVYRGGPVAYTIVVTNNGTYALTGTVVDTLPATVTGATWTCAATLPSFCGAASGSGNINSTVTLAAGASATYTISNGTLSAAASGTLVNTATVAVPSWLTDSTPANNTATDTDTINLNANLGITKTDGLTNINPGNPVTYTIVVSNAGPDASNGSIVTDTVPASITGVTWTCGSPTGGSTCGAASGSGNSINTTANLTSGGSVTYTVSGTLSAGATGTLTNTARVVTPAAGVTDPNDPTRTGANNNSATDNTTIVLIPDLTINKSHVGNFTQGQNNAPYTLVVTNSGSASTSGTVTVTDTLPAGLTYVSFAGGGGWSCSAAGQVVTCTNSTVIAAAASFATLTLNVNVSSTAAASVTNNVTVSGGGETNVSNDSDADPTTINGAPDLTITKSHAGNFTQGQANAPYTLTVNNIGRAATAGTITVTDTLPVSLTFASGGAAPWSCSAVGQVVTCTSSGSIAALGNSGITLLVNVANNAPASVTNNVTVSGGGQTNTTNDSASDPTTITQLPDLTINKTHVGNFTQGQTNAPYTITVTNSGNAPTTAATVTVTDTLPAGLTYASAAPASWSCSAAGQVVTCTASAVIGAGASYPALTLNVNVSATAPASVTNNVTVAGGGQINTTNDSDSDPTTINQLADLTITKTHAGNFTQGQANAPYTLTVTNSGTGPTSGTVTVTDTLPAGLTYASFAGGGGWSCSAAGQVVTCTNSTVIAASSSFAALTLNVNVSSTAAASVTNNASVAGGGEINVGNNSATDVTAINGAPDLTITKSHVGNFTQGQSNAAYTLTVNNIGRAASAGTITVTDTLPAGLTFVSGGPAPWSCSAAGQIVTCTRATAIAALGNSAITLLVNVSPTAPASMTNNVTVSGGGQTNTTNDSASDPTTINQVADLTITKTHTGNFTRGLNGSYTITVTNSGPTATSGTVTVTDTLPAGLTPTGWSGAAPWSCIISAQTVTCTNTSVLNAGLSFPALSITVAVGQGAASSLTNVATVSGGGQVNTANDSASDPTTIVSSSDLSLTKTVNNPTPTINQNVTFTLTLSNAGPTDATGITILDQLPAGLTFVSATPSSGSYVSGTGVWTVASLASGANATLQIVAQVVTSGPITNTAEVTASGQPDPDSTPNNHIGTEDDQASVTLSAPASPNVGLVKNVSPGGTQIPGTDLLYTIVYTNTGGQAANSFAIVDPNPANAIPAERIFHNVDFKVGSLTSNPGSTGLVASFQYSNDGGTTWTYTPVSGGGGAPAGYDRVVTNVRWSFAGSLSQTAPNNSGSVTLTVRIR
ncbi:MAG TPA: DUF11 domain-containing protein [Pyrinomonadaceae bacterium]|nr:DUF11 domain-containing protein [Pyrinomonadaceae bacterium]